MFRNRDRGLSNTLYWFFEVWNNAYNGALPHYSEGKSKKNCKHFEQRFSLHTNGEQTCLGLPELLLISETSTMSSIISVRIGTVLRYSFFVNYRCEIDLSAWQQQLENSYHKFYLDVTSRSAEPTPVRFCHVFMGPTHPRA